jgi:hypothetical protein
MDTAGWHFGLEAWFWCPKLVENTGPMILQTSLKKSVWMPSKTK